MLKQLLIKFAKTGVSDIHLKSNEPPLVREFGQLNAVGTTPLKSEEVESMVKSLLKPKQLEQLQKRGDVDCALSVEKLGRLRINVYKERGNYALAIRIIPAECKNFESLHLPKKTMENLCRTSRGLIIISGVTGAGKTTTLNSIVNFMNENFNYNIISIEDPIEYTHQRKKSSISQREVGRDVVTFTEGLRFVLRQDPDVIVLGEMRNQETFDAAIEGASSGHLVLATLHSSDTMDAIDRIVNAYDAQKQAHIRSELTNSLKAIISLRLVKEKYGKACYPATEVLFGTLQIKKLLSEGRANEIQSLLEQSNPYGMHSFDQDLLRLFEEGLISPQEAINHASKPNNLRIKLQGQNDSPMEIMK